MLHIFSRPRSSLFLLLFLDFFLNFLISFFLSISGAHASEIINLLRVYIRLIRNIYSSSRRRGIPESPPAPGGLITSTRQNWKKKKEKRMRVGGWIGRQGRSSARSEDGNWIQSIGESLWSFHTIGSLNLEFFWMEEARWRHLSASLSFFGHFLLDDNPKRLGNLFWNFRTIGKLNFWILDFFWWRRDGGAI